MHQLSLPVYVADTRTRVELEQQRIKFDGIISSDDFSGYNGYPVLAQRKFGTSAGVITPEMLIRGNNPVLGQVFLNLIDEATFSIGIGDTQDSLWSPNVGFEFKYRVSQSLQQWMNTRGYDK